MFRRSRIIVGAVLGLLFVTAATHASTISYRFEGVVTSVEETNGDLSALGIEVGSNFYGSFTYDPSTPLSQFSSGPTDIAQYGSSVSKIYIKVDGQHRFSSEGGQYLVSTDSNYGQFNSQMFQFGDTDHGWLGEGDITRFATQNSGESRLNVQLTDNDNGSLRSNSLTSSLPLTKFEEGQVSVYGSYLEGGSLQYYGFGGVISEIGQAGAQRVPLIYQSGSTDPQRFYLDFGDSHVDYTEDLIKTIFGLGTNSPDSGLSASSIADIVSQLETIYEDYNVEFYTSKPTGQFSTIYFGGSDEIVHGPNSKTYWGTASNLDWYNKDKDDFAFVFTEEFSAGSEKLRLIAETTAHEVGHLLGLHHQYPIGGNIMASGTQSLSTSEEILDGYYRMQVGGSSALQNSHQALGHNVGLKDPSTFDASLPGAVNSLFDTVTFIADSVFGTIYDAAIAIIFGEDTFPTIVDLEDIYVGSVDPRYLPTFEGVEFFLFGSSVEGGQIDVFSSPELLDLLGPEFLLTDLGFEMLASQFPAGSSSHLNLYRWQEGLGFSDFGSIEVVAAEKSVPEPQLLPLLVIGVMTMRGLSRRKKGVTRS